MSGTFDKSWRRLAATGVLAAALLALSVGQARAASYPAGGSGFNGGPEGWSSPVPATCNLPVICTPNAGYDGANGNPAGSLALDTNILINALGLVKSSGSFVSPNFVTKDGGSATLGLQREIVSTGLLDLTPQGTYTATLIDRSTGVSSTIVSDTVTSAEAGFGGKSGAAKVVAGHTYAIQIDAESSSNIVGLALLGGSTALRFDNVSLTVGSSGGGDNGGGGGGGDNGGGGNDGAKGNGGAKGHNGANGISSKRLRTLIRRSGVGGAAALRGNFLRLRLRCPAKAGRKVCHFNAIGMLNRHRKATVRRGARIHKGRAKVVSLRIRPRARGKLKKRNRVLVKMQVRAGKRKVTVYKSVRLAKRR